MSRYLHEVLNSPTRKSFSEAKPRKLSKKDFMRSLELKCAETQKSKINQIQVTKKIKIDKGEKLDAPGKRTTFFRSEKKILRNYSNFKLG